MELKDKKIQASVEEINIALQNLITTDFFKLLMAYTVKRLKSRFKIKYNPDRGFMGKMVEDIVSEVISSFLDEGGRNWYKDKFPEFKSQLFSALDSHISNTISKDLDKSSVTEEFEDVCSVLEIDNLEFTELNKFCITFLESAGADLDELLVFECITKGLTRKQISEELEIPPDKVTHIKKRLDRKLIPLRKHLDEYYNEK